MSMFDEGALIDALSAAANGFEISNDATDRILSEAQASVPAARSFTAPAFLRHPGRARTFVMAAALVVVVSAISLPLLRSEGVQPKTAVEVHGAEARAGSQLSVTGTGFTKTLVQSPRPVSAAASSTSSGSATGLSDSSLSLSPKIESNGSVALTVGVGHVESSLTKLGDLVTSDGGFVLSTKANARTRGSGEFSNGTIVLQVPQRTFATLVTQVQRVGHSRSIVTSSTDVTSQYVDLRALITALEASRRQYLSIMTRATSISDILAVQSQLNVLQSQIEQFQGQMNVLNSETTYGTLTVNLTEAGQPSNVTPHRSGLAKAWHDAVAGFVAGFEWLIRLSGPVLFAVLCLGTLFALGRFVRRAARRRRI